MGKEVGMTRLTGIEPLRVEKNFFLIILFSVLSFGLFLASTVHAQVQPVRGASGDFWADVVLGQPDFSGTSLHATNQTLFRPGGVFVDIRSNPQRLFVYDSGNNRILGFSDINIAITRQGGKLGVDLCLGADSSALPMGADMVLGQPDFNHTAANGDSNYQQYPGYTFPDLNYLPVPTSRTLDLLYPWGNSLGEGSSRVDRKSVV